MPTHVRPRVKGYLLWSEWNRISGSWDQGLLARLLADLNAVPDVDLSLSGFSDEELQKQLKSLESREKKEQLETFDVAQALKAAQAAPIAHIGDLWLLGEHRLLCGDSIDSGGVGQLMNGQKASLLATDPPYPGGLLRRQPPGFRRQPT